MTCLILFPLLVLVHNAAAIIGYDCGSRALNITTLSLLDVEPCEMNEHSLNVTDQYIQLLQIDKFVENPVIQCKLEIHRTVYHCGMFSHIALVGQGETEYIYDISRHACYIAHLTGTLKFDQTKVITGIKMNQTQTYPMTFAGSLDESGKCQGTSYADPYGSWDSVVVQGTLKITLQQHHARVELNNNKIHLRSGTVCTLTDGVCIDMNGGHTFWKQISDDICKFNRYSILYEGHASKIIDMSMRKPQTVYSLSSNDITFALASTGQQSVCGYQIYTTEHPKLVVYETTKGVSFAGRRKESVENLDMFLYVNTKFVYVERHIRTQINLLYRDILQHRCNLERETLKNALAIATKAPDEFAYNLMKGPGYMAVAAGEVVHVIKCIPVEVQVEHGDECYSELRVTRRNVTYFMTPRTHLLKLRGTRITCNPLLPAQFLLNKSWYKMVPKPVETIHPWTLRPMTSPTWSYINPASLARSGIYTEKDLDELRDRIMFPVEQPALLNEIAREIHGHPVSEEGGTISKLLNEDAVNKIVESTWGKIWRKFMTFGTASAGIIAIFVIFQLVKLIIGMLINGYMLHQAYGWSILLLGALWSSLARLLIYKKKPVEPRELITMRYEKDDPESAVVLDPLHAHDDAKPSTSAEEGQTDQPKSSGFFNLK